MTKRILITVAGWEERFFGGMRNDISAFAPEIVLNFYSTDYSEWTAKGRAELEVLCTAKNITYKATELDFKDQVSSFAKLNESLHLDLPDSSVVRFNATTAPRDIIWLLLHHLQSRSIHAQFSYYRALGYGDWLSRDARPPRLVMKRSGIMYPDLPTCLLILSGYDYHRLGQLIRKFEPRKVILGIQTGTQLGNKERNKPTPNGHVEDTTQFGLDCFDARPEVAEAILSQIGPLMSDYNIIAASLGPKPSALTLFRLTNIAPQIGLVYNPAAEYNQNYSHGVDLENVTIAQI